MVMRERGREMERKIVSDVFALGLRGETCAQIISEKNKLFSTERKFPM